MQISPHLGAAAKKEKVIMTRKQYFSSGLKDGMPICFGYFAVSFAFGIQAAGIGLSVFEASVLSALNVTSAGQFAALAIIASGASLIELAFTQLIINLRYFPDFFSP